MSVTTQANTTRITSNAVTIQWYANTPVYWAGYKLAGQSEYTEVYNDLNRIGNYVGYFTIKELTEETYYTATVKLIAVDGTILEADYPTVSFTTPALGAIAADIQTKLLGNDTVLVNWQTNIGINSLEYTINSEASVEVPVTAGFTTGSFYINGIFDQDELTITLANSALSSTITLTIHITNADYIETNKDRILPAIDVDVNNLLFPYIYYDPSEKSRGKLTALEWNTIMHLLIHQGNYTAKALNTLDLDILKINPHAIMIVANQLDLADTSENNVQAKLDYLKTLIDNVVLGGIPDNSLAKTKLLNTFAETIPTNEDMGILYLASRYHTPTNTGDQPSDYSSPALTNINRQGYTITNTYPTSFTGTGGTTNTIDDIYTMIGGDGTQYIGGSGGSGKSFILECPKYIKLSQIILTTENKYVHKLLGSYDGINWDLIADLPEHNIKGTNTVNITNSNYYKYFSISSNGSMRIYNDIQLIGTQLNTVDNSNKLILSTTGNAKLTEYYTGQIIKLELPNNYVTGLPEVATLNINNLGAKELPLDILPDTKYSLVYDGIKFIKEV